MSKLPANLLSPAASVGTAGNGNLDASGGAALQHARIAVLVEHPELNPVFCGIHEAAYVQSQPSAPAEHGRELSTKCWTVEVAIAATSEQLCAMVSDPLSPVLRQNYL